MSSKIINKYENAKGETVLVYANGMKIRESLAEQRRAEHAAKRAERSAELRRRWVEFCEKIDVSPDDE